MTKYNEGDKLTLIRGDSAITGVIEPGGIQIHAEDFARVGVDWLIEKGWQVTGVKPKVELPSEPGTVIRDSDGVLWVRWEDGYWESHADLRRADTLVDQGAIRAGFSLHSEPRAVTAKAVLDRVLDIPGIRGDEEANLRHGVKKLAEEFGVTTNV